MQNDDQLEAVLARLRVLPDPVLPEGFMDGVWTRAGQMEEVSARRTRHALFTAMAFVGLAAGFGTAQAPAKTEPRYQLVAGSDLSPAALLHVES